MCGILLHARAPTATPAPTGEPRDPAWPGQLSLFMAGNKRRRAAEVEKAAKAEEKALVRRIFAGPDLPPLVLQARVDLGDLHSALPPPAASL